MQPFVLVRGKPFFADARPPLRFVVSDPVGDATIKLIDVPPDGAAVWVLPPVV